jgi:hypothetical protein
MDFNPTITPVMDLSSIKTGSEQMDKMFGKQTLNVGAIASKAAAITFPENLISNSVTSTEPIAKSNVTFIQNNTSPKELSRIDIYRQTKNQLLSINGLEGGL